jgi:hypothetical protein
MDQEEAQALAAATEGVTSLKEYVEELKQLIRDFDAFFEGHMPYTYSNGRDGILLRERIKELGADIEEDEDTPDLVVEMHNVTSDPDEDDPLYVHPEDRPRGGAA